MSISYDEFIKLFPSNNPDEQNNCYYKFLNNSMTHFGFTYELGLNVDTKEFNPSGTCEAGGLYFSNYNYIHNFTNFGEKLAIIELLDDAEFYIDPEGYKAKTNKFIIKNIVCNPLLEIEYAFAYGFPRISYSDIPKPSPTGLYYAHIDSHNYVLKNYVLKKLQKMTTIDGYCDKIKISRQSKQISTPGTGKILYILLCGIQPDSNFVCSENNQFANDGLLFFTDKLIIYDVIEDKDIDKINEYDVRQYTDPIYIQEKNIEKFKNQNLIQTYNDCKNNLSNDGLLLKYTQNQTEDLCLIAVNQNGLSLEFVYPKNKTKSVCDCAIKQNPNAIKFM